MPIGLLIIAGIQRMFCIKPYGIQLMMPVAHNCRNSIYDLGLAKEREKITSSHCNKKEEKSIVSPPNAGFTRQ